MIKQILRNEKAVSVAFIYTLSVITLAALIALAPLRISHAAGDDIVLVAYGDSLMAGYQLQQRDAFPRQLERALRKKGYNVKVVNAGVSGDTARAGLNRLDWTLPKNADGVILELGANDALRGLDVVQMRRALETIVQKLQQRNIDILLAGMEAPRSLGPDYVTAFANTYQDLASQYKLLFYPFFLEGIALQARYNLADGMHPNPKGVAIIVENIMPKVEQLISQIKKRKGS